MALLLTLFCIFSFTNCISITWVYPLEEIKVISVEVTPRHLHHVVGPELSHANVPSAENLVSSREAKWCHSWTCLVCASSFKILHGFVSVQELLCSDYWRIFFFFTPLGIKKRFVWLINAVRHECKWSKENICILPLIIHESQLPMN